jgi:hypothetical protein
MLSDKQFQSIHPKLKTLQIIVVALAGGIILFAFVTNVIAPWAQSAMDISMLPLLGAVASFFSMLLSFVMPAMVVGNVPRVSGDDSEQGQQRKLKGAANIFVTSRLIRAALLEGSCFLNLVVYILEKSQLSLIFTAIGLFLLMLSFPTASAFRSWIETNALD